ncbi:MAG: mannose-6-phosphate isomerase, class I [Kiritimatiellae bacterium]|nr:mannose-6-phosphate isomerase, class I [Kiritimatiellia bacterium]
MLPKFLVLQNTVQKYPWGSIDSIPTLLGESNTNNEPWAELWMGAHSKAPSVVAIDNTEISLATLIDERPADILGSTTSNRFENKLPFLFKVLAAGKPLSIQAHPNLAQAKEGFARENDAGIPIDAPERNYRDDNHKPEIICALTPFRALRGFRKISEIIRLLDLLDLQDLNTPLENLRSAQDKNGLKQFFNAIMTMDKTDQQKLIADAVKSADNSEDCFEWIHKLNAEYPSDIGVLMPILLNLVLLEPGQAMFLPAGELHAYLDGTGIELMANSDNVLRGGLTPKHMDVPELLNLLTFTTGAPEILTPKTDTTSEQVYASETPEFMLSVITPDKDSSYMSKKEHSAEIMICTAGEASLIQTNSQATIKIHKGISVLIPAATRQYEIKGNATIYKATTGRDGDGPNGSRPY